MCRESIALVRPPCQKSEIHSSARPSVEKAPHRTSAPCSRENLDDVQTGNIHVALTSFPDVLDIFSSRNIQSHTMVGWENGDKDVHSASAAKKPNSYKFSACAGMAFPRLMNPLKSKSPGLAVRSFPSPSESSLAAIDSVHSPFHTDPCDSSDE
jgi:hypothetical protein